MFFQLGAMVLLGTLSVSSALPPCVCTRNLRPVCGSDGQTYGNECLLQCAQVSNPQLFMERIGRCDGSGLGPPRDVRQAQVDCICTLEYQPFCGTNGRTYPNRCALNCDKRSEPVEIAYPGQCRNKRDVDQDAQLPSRCSCPRNVAPVCGTDGNLYKNPCYLKCAKNKNKDLAMAYYGECDKIEDSQVCVGCTDEVRPMCGTDGKTYRSPCMLNCARENDENLHIDYVGPCDTRLIVVDSLACAGCTPKKKPVCGTDGNTYRNPCMLNCARDDDENLHIAYVGHCGDRDRFRVVEKSKNFPCTCNRNIKPVCASNGVTFSNECLMKCAGIHLTVENDGPCEE